MTYQPFPSHYECMCGGELPPPRPWSSRRNAFGAWGPLLQLLIPPFGASAKNVTSEALVRPRKRAVATGFKEAGFLTVWKRRRYTALSAANSCPPRTAGRKGPSPVGI